MFSNVGFPQNHHSTNSNDIFRGKTSSENIKHLIAQLTSFMMNLTKLITIATINSLS